MGKIDPDEKLVAPPDFKVSGENRRFTDLLCTILLFVSWGVMSYIGYFSFQNGDIRLILNPTDHEGNLCGLNYEGKDLTEFPFLYYVNAGGGGVCVKECPDLSPPNETMMFDPYTLVTYGGLYQLDGFSTFDANIIQIANYTESEDKCTADTCFPNKNPILAFTAEDGINRGFGSAFFLLDTTNFLNRCIPTIESYEVISDLTNFSLTEFGEQLNLDFSMAERSLEDFWTARYWIPVCGFGVALVMSFLYISLLRIPCLLSTVVWTSVFLINVMIFGAGVYIYYNAEAWGALSLSKETYLYISYAIFGVGGLFFILIVFMRKSIQLSLTTVGQTSKAISKMPLISLYPILQSIALFIVLGVWAVYAVLLAATGTLTIGTMTNPFNDVVISVREFQYDNITYYYLGYLVFSLFWTYQFISSMGQIIVAMCVARWYFTREKSTVGSGTVLRSICASFYHTGTAAFGALLLAILRVFRVMLARVQKMAKDADNRIGQILLCCCACCLKCLDNFLRFMNKTAFIQTAIFGTSFCESAQAAFFLIARNTLTIGALQIVTSLVSIIGRVFIACSTGMASYFAMDFYLKDELSHPGYPCILIVIFAYYVADSFFDIFDIGTHTILHCFMADNEMFSESESYAEPALKRFIDDSNK